MLLGSNTSITRNSTLMIFAAFYITQIGIAIIEFQKDLGMAKLCKIYFFLEIADHLMKE